MPRAIDFIALAMECLFINIVSMEGIKPSRDARSELKEGTGSGGHEDYPGGGSDYPHHKEPGFVSVDEIPDTNGMTPEEVLLEKEEAERE